MQKNRIRLVSEHYRGYVISEFSHEYKVVHILSGDIFAFPPTVAVAKSMIDDKILRDAASTPPPEGPKAS